MGALLHLRPSALQIRAAFCIFRLHYSFASQKQFQDVRKITRKEGRGSQTETSSLISGGVCRNTKSIGSRAGGFQSTSCLK